jgi:undecaprenyl-diphosphatase
MSIIEVLILSVVEGLTEFLPVSSTGHMIIAQHLMGTESTPFVKSFTVMIQFGAILSVVALYWRRFFTPATGWSFYGRLLLAFLPAAAVGLCAGELIDALLENVKVVAVMLIAGGVFMLFADRLFEGGEEGAGSVTYGRALRIGLFQCIALVPGVSRSMATIVGGMAQGLTRREAAEFSFFLAVPTMAAATGYKALQLASSGEAGEALRDNMWALALGNVVSFVVAGAAIRLFIGYISRYGFKTFGWYRIGVGTAILVLLLTGHNLAIV